jgi:arabinosyltransferase C
MDHLGGGPLGISELLFDAGTVPSYLRDDWSRDWGSLQRLVPYDPGAVVAQLQRGTAVRSGWWSPAPLRPA